MIKKVVGGERLGAGSKLQVELHNFERSTHDLSFIWRSTMAPGTLVPFMAEVALPGDTFDIDLDCDVKTHPTLGPLFGSFKVQLDTFQVPIRLYQALLHNNVMNIGLKMNQVMLPVIQMMETDVTGAEDIDNAQINPSSLPAHLGMRGVGYPATSQIGVGRYFNATTILGYWDIVKNYYANKQEEIGAVIHAPSIVGLITSIKVNNTTLDTVAGGPPAQAIVFGDTITVTYTGGIRPTIEDIRFYYAGGGWTTLISFADEISDTGSVITFEKIKPGTQYVDYWKYSGLFDVVQLPPKVETFPLANIDQMKNELLSNAQLGAAFSINNTNGGQGIIPYKWLYEQPGGKPGILNSQEGLAVKTYQSDMFNAWLQTDWIDGTTGINTITAIDTSSGEFTIDTLNLAKKVYDMLNRIAVSGGSYDDWMDAVYSHEQYRRVYSPMYMGGLSKELMFQEVVSNAATTNSDTGQPLGTIAGKGVMTNKHKGGKVRIKVDEPSYIMGIISLTPRIDYSQGNKWDLHLKTMDDFHKPGLDEIGFQELITEQMAWWDTQYSNPAQKWVQKSAGKQPAWTNYMTNVNVVRGNFAIRDNEMFMTLNRRYEMDLNNGVPNIKDLTTYIDPSKYNFIFAETSIDAQNFWTQIAVNMIARRKMSAKVMPSL